MFFVNKLCITNAYKYVLFEYPNFLTQNDIKRTTKSIDVWHCDIRRQGQQMTTNQISCCQWKTFTSLGPEFWKRRVSNLFDSVFCVWKSLCDYI